jgi:hypothetical protein
MTWRTHALAGACTLLLLELLPLSFLADLALVLLTGQLSWM